MPCTLQPWEVAFEDGQALKRLAIKQQRMLCTICRRLEKAKLLNVLSDGTLKWWTEHKRNDTLAKRRGRRKSP